MTQEEAKAAVRARAFVTVRSDDRGPHCKGQVIDVRGDTATIRNGSAVRDVDIGRLKFDVSRNAECGVRVDVAEECKRPVSAEPFVVVESLNWTGWSGSAWVQDDAQWQRYASAERAKADKQRFHANGVKGCEVLRESVAQDRFLTFLEERTAPSVETGIDDLKLPDDYGGLAVIAEAWKEIAKAVEEDSRDRRDTASDEDLIAKMESEILDLNRRIHAVRSRITERDQRRLRRKASVAGFKAQLTAVLRDP
jgi:hypothetical protein